MAAAPEGQTTLVSDRWRVSRDPGDWHPTTHLGDRLRRRDIPSERIGETIANGETRAAPGGVVHFVADTTADDPLTVVGDPADGEVVTAYYDDS